MTDPHTPDDGLDQAIRAAIRDLVVAAPPAPTYAHLTDPTRDAAAGAPDRRRWWAAVAAAAVVAVGLGALAYGLNSRDELTPATTPTVPAPAPSIAPTSTTIDSPSPTADPTTPDAGTTAPSTPPTGAPTFPSPNSDVFPEPGDAALTTQTAIAPSGSIDAAPGDMVTLGVDGDVWLHRGAFDPLQYGRPPEAATRLVDGDDVRNSEGEVAPNTPQWVGGFVNGALIYGDCCEPAVGNVFAVSEPEGPPAQISYGWSARADTSGRRWAAVSDYALTLFDYNTGRGVSRQLNLGGDYLNVSEVAWSPDDTELWVFGQTLEQGASLLRFRADHSLSELGRVELGAAPGVSSPARLEFAGRMADGTTVLTQHGPDAATTLATLFLDSTGQRRTEQSPWALPDGARQVQVSPDGTTLAVVTDDSTAYLVRSGEDPVEWATDVSAVWFVATPALPIGTADCPTPDDPNRAGWTFADLDGDGVSERLIVDGEDLVSCGTPFSLRTATTGTTPLAVDVDGDGRTEVWLGDTENPDTKCVSLWAVYGSDEFVPTGPLHCIGPSQEGFGCVMLGRTPLAAFYEFTEDEAIARSTEGIELGRRSLSDWDPELAPNLFDLSC